MSEITLTNEFNWDNEEFGGRNPEECLCGMFDYFVEYGWNEGVGNVNSLIVGGLESNQPDDSKFWLAIKKVL